VVEEVKAAAGNRAGAVGWQNEDKTGSQTPTSRDRDPLYYMLAASAANAQVFRYSDKKGSPQNG
jgi:hypothetical protein